MVFSGHLICSDFWLDSCVLCVSRECVISALKDCLLSLKPVSRYFSAFSLN